MSLQAPTVSPYYYNDYATDESNHYEDFEETKSTTTPATRATTNNSPDLSIIKNSTGASKESKDASQGQTTKSKEKLLHATVASSTTKPTKVTTAKRNSSTEKNNPYYYEYGTESNEYFYYFEKSQKATQIPPNTNIITTQSTINPENLTTFENEAIHTKETSFINFRPENKITPLTTAAAMETPIGVRPLLVFSTTRKTYSAKSQLTTTDSSKQLSTTATKTTNLKETTTNLQSAVETTPNYDNEYVTQEGDYDYEVDIDADLLTTKLKTTTTASNTTQTPTSFLSTTIPTYESEYATEIGDYDESDLPSYFVQETTKEKSTKATTTTRLQSSTVAVLTTPDYDSDYATEPNDYNEIDFLDFWNGFNNPLLTTASTTAQAKYTSLQTSEKTTARLTQPIQTTINALAAPDYDSDHATEPNDYNEIDFLDFWNGFNNPFLTTAPTTTAQAKPTSLQNFEKTTARLTQPIQSTTNAPKLFIETTKTTRSKSKGVTQPPLYENEYITEAGDYDEFEFQNILKEKSTSEKTQRQTTQTPTKLDATSLSQNTFQNAATEDNNFINGRKTLEKDTTTATTLTRTETTRLATSPVGTTLQSTTTLSAYNDEVTEANDYGEIDFFDFWLGFQNPFLATPLTSTAATQPKRDTTTTITALKPTKPRTTAARLIKTTRPVLFKNSQKITQKSTQKLVTPTKPLYEYATEESDYDEIELWKDEKLKTSTKLPATAKPHITRAIPKRVNPPKKLEIPDYNPPKKPEIPNYYEYATDANDYEEFWENEQNIFHHTTKLTTKLPVIPSKKPTPAPPSRGRVIIPLSIRATQGKLVLFLNCKLNKQ